MAASRSVRKARSRRGPTTRASRAKPPRIARVVTLRENGQMTLPAELRQRVGARTGDVFVADVEDDAIVLRRKQLVDADQAFFWTTQWQKAERDVDADIFAGRLKRANSVKELLAELKR